VEAMWMVGAENAQIKLTDGKITWDDNHGHLYIQQDRNEVLIQREHIKVIDCGVWDVGLMISPKKAYKLGKLDLAGLTVYLYGFDSSSKLSEFTDHFLSTCQRWKK